MQSYFQTQAIGSGKRVRTRHLLIDTAIDVFSDKGIDEASVHEITALAGLANGTFYNHFKDKDELALAASHAIALEIAKRLDQHMHDVDRGVSRVVIASWAFLRLALGVAPWAAVLVAQHQRHPSPDAPAFAYMRADIERAVQQGELDVEVDDLLIEQIVGLMMVAMRRMLMDGPDSEVLMRTCESQLRLLGMTPGRATRAVAQVTGHALLAADPAAINL